MCILFAYLNPNPQRDGFKLVLASNRDEVYSRPAKPAHQWLNYPDVYGGIDMQPGKEGGTWLAINKHGRIGILLNIGQRKEVNAIDEKSGRGSYVVHWVAHPDKCINEVFEDIKKWHGDSQQLFRLITISINEDPQIASLVCHNDTEQTFQVEYLSPGIHAMGNNAPNNNWQKVVEGKVHFTNIVGNIKSWAEKEELVERLIDMLTNKERFWPDEAIIHQLGGKSLTVLESLSSVFVDIPAAKYGTRTQTVILVGSDNDVLFYERTLDGLQSNSMGNWVENQFNFKLCTK